MHPQPLSFELVCVPPVVDEDDDVDCVPPVVDEAEDVDCVPPVVDEDEDDDCVPPVEDEADDVVCVPPVLEEEDDVAVAGAGVIWISAEPVSDEDVASTSMRVCAPAVPKAPWIVSAPPENDALAGKVAAGSLAVRFTAPA